MSFAAVETVLNETALEPAGAPHRDVGDEAGADVVLCAALALTGVGVCLCDAEDRVRFVNEAFRAAMFPGLRCEGERFADLLGLAIPSEGSMRLDSMPLDRFVMRVQEDRRRLQTERAFPLDLKDGRWLYVNDRKLPSGWILAITMDISSIKHEEFRLRAAHSSAVREASTDVLTAIPNRRHGLELAETAIGVARTELRPLSIAILDIDHFKRINDTFGHQAGDRVLVDFASMLVRRAPPPMAVARIGGEEFLMVMPRTTATQAKVLLDGVAQDLAPAGLAPCAAEIRYSFSAGLSELRAGEDLDGLLARTDEALYRAKRDGRARIEIDAGRDATRVPSGPSASRRAFRASPSGT